MSKYKCVKCRKTFNNEAILKTHTCNKPQHKKLVQCNLCPKSFISQSKLKNHMRSHSNEKTFKCSKCNESFKSPTGLKAHENRHNGVEYKCVRCEKSFFLMQKLKLHNRTVRCGPKIDEKPFNCLKCSETFNDETTLKTHNCKQQYLKSVHCNICPMSFHLRSHLKVHMRSHSNEKIFKCSKCNACYKSLNALKYHENIHNGMKCTQSEKSLPSIRQLKEHKQYNLCGLNCDEKPFKFLKCNESFKSPTSLKNHEEKHNDIKFKCALCEKSFRSVRLLKYHNRIVCCGPNSDVNPFKCLKCNKCFKTSEGLGMHENRHNGIEYKCDQCEKSFPAVQLLKQHKRKTLCCHNSDEKLFKCLKCYKDFKSSFHLKFHEKRCHGIKYECAQCGQFFITAQGLKNHKQNVCCRSTLKLVCNICFKSFKFKFNLIKHLRLHDTGDEHQCKYCNKLFSSSFLLTRHEQTHNGESGFRFRSKSSLSQHDRVVHKVGKLLRCENRNKSFDNNANLLRHKNKYYRKPKLKCYECLELFENESLLNVHVKNHSVFRKQFPCFNCGISFDLAQILKAHAYVHTNVRPFECDECKSTFKRKGNLNEHKHNIHTGIRMHHCFQCNESFSAACNLRAHLQSLKHKCKVKELQIQGGAVKDKFVNADQVASSNYQMHPEKSDDNNISLTSDVQLNDNSYNEHLIKEEASSIDVVKSFHTDTELMEQSLTNTDEKKFEQSSNNFNRYLLNPEDISDNDTILLTSEIQIKDELLNQYNSDNSTVLLTSDIQVKEELTQYNYDNSNILITSEIEIKDESIQHFAEGEQTFIRENSLSSYTQF